MICLINTVINHRIYQQHNQKVLLYIPEYGYLILSTTLKNLFLGGTKYHKKIKTNKEMLT